MTIKKPITKWSKEEDTSSFGYNATTIQESELKEVPEEEKL